MSYPAALRVALGLLLALAGALAHAGHETAYSDRNGSDWAVKNQLLNWIEGGTGVPVMRSELNPMIVLAALDSPPKRQDMLESKGAIAVIYPDIGEPFRSVFAKIIEGIEEQAKVRVTATRSDRTAIRPT
ncbi:hypothetical protein ACFQAT_12155 [Undibacterium arcticum]|uniref:hypothetical protein n=1 Tax=Undibacterium arcticum TaxID=1762892 RepID=UPI0036066C50